MLKTSQKTRSDREPGDGERAAPECAIGGDLERGRRLRYVRPGRLYHFISWVPAGLENIARRSSLAWGHEICWSALLTASTTFAGSGM